MGLFDRHYPPYLGHPVAINPTGDPSYIDGQVADILVEMQQEETMPFVEGQPVGVLVTQNVKGPVIKMLMGVTAPAFNLMATRVWRDHGKLSVKERNKPYVTYRKAEGVYFKWEWSSLSRGFHVTPSTDVKDWSKS